MKADTRLAKLETEHRDPAPLYRIPILTGDDPEPDPSTVPPGRIGVTSIRLVGVAPGARHANA